MLDIKAEAWDDGEMIITINGEPLGYSLSRHDSIVVKDWLQGAQSELVSIITDVMDDGERRD